MVAKESILSISNLSKKRKSLQIVQNPLYGSSAHSATASGAAPCGGGAPLVAEERRVARVAQGGGRGAKARGACCAAPARPASPRASVAVKRALRLVGRASHLVLRSATMN
ncbi:unnamed protein product [Euphydryas editha]|uniref:Uncharacterized protein n=1 Tax=Euphydryas editha TaxID=104508 RepID=A0AAU9V7Q9_EUPED|nr:unnamed protein product [Euphydryas editha]